MSGMHVAPFTVGLATGWTWAGRLRIRAPARPGRTTLVELSYLQDPRRVALELNEQHGLELRLTDAEGREFSTGAIPADCFLDRPTFLWYSLVPPAKDGAPTELRLGIEDAEPLVAAVPALLGPPGLARLAYASAAIVPSSRGSGFHSSVIFNDVLTAAELAELRGKLEEEADQ